LTGKEKAELRRKKRELDEKRPFQARAFSDFIARCFFGALIVCVSFAILYPVLALLPLAFTDMRVAGDPGAVWIPPEFSLQSFYVVFNWILRTSEALKDIPLELRPGPAAIFLYTLFYAFSIAAIQVFMSSLAGYALARTRFRGSTLGFLLVILVFLIPRQSFLIPQWLNFKQFDLFGLVTLFRGAPLDLINQPLTLYMMAFFGFLSNQSLMIFIMRQFFMAMPHELEEAAHVDGLSFNQTYLRIMLPNAAPALLTVASLAFVWAYGDNYYTAYFNPNGPYLGMVIQAYPWDSVWVLAAVTRDWFGAAATNNLAVESVRQAAVLVFLAPLLVFYFIIQRRIVENLDSIGIKG
jgi:multiple sugar transport system permease protein